MVQDLSEHDARAFLQGKAGDARADGGESDALDGFFFRAQQGLARREAERIGSRLPAQRHAGRVDYVKRLEVAARRDRSLAHRDGPQALALLLDARAALAPDGPGYARAENQVVVGRVHDGVHRHVGDVAFDETDLGVHPQLPIVALLVWQVAEKLVGNVAGGPARSEREISHVAYFPERDSSLRSE